MFNARECRRAADDALGANGSCTCTKSKSTASSSDSSVVGTAAGYAAPERRAGGPKAARSKHRRARSPLGGGLRLDLGLARQLRGATVLGDELLGEVARHRVGDLGRRRLHEVRARALERTA